MRTRILSKIIAALLLWLAALPVFLLMAAVWIPHALWLAALLPVAALLLTGGAALLPTRRRVPALLLAILIMAAGCAALFLPGNPLALLLLLPCLLLMLLFMPAMARPAHREWTLSLLGVGIGLHVVAQIAKNFALFAAAAPAVSWALAAYLLACLFSFNRIVLMGTGAPSSGPMLSFNRRMLMVFCLLSLLLANIQAVGTAIRTAILWAVAAVIQVVYWLASLLAPGANPDGGTMGGSGFMPGMEEAAEPSLFSQILQYVLMSVALLLLAVLLFFAGRHLYRLLKKAFRILGERLRLYRQKISADYQDQSESLLDWQEIRQATKKRITRLKHRYLPTAWEKLSPAQRVRRVYILLLRRQDTPDPALTARETLADGTLKLSDADAEALAALYDKARYSDHPIPDAEADALRKRAGV